MKTCQENSKFPLYRVDAFASGSFSGNPAGVCLINKPVDDSLLQAIATEVNLSETAFLFIQGWETLKTSRNFRIRWFTPQREVSLCGHATLAAAAVLYREIGMPAEPVVFDSAHGQLRAEIVDNELLQLDFPAFETSESSPSRVLISALGVSHYRSVRFAESIQSFLIHVAGEDIVAGLQPHFESLRTINEPVGLQGVIVTAQGNTSFDFISRYFAPWVGIDEDPVTGSAHCVLAPYWAKLLKKSDLHAYQASARGGVIDCQVTDDGRVLLRGKAIIFSRGNIFPHGYHCDEPH